MQRPRLLITRRLPEAVHERLRIGYDLTANIDDVPLDRAALASALRDFDALVPTITDRFDGELLRAAPFRTRIIANFGAGIEHIDLRAAKSANIVVSNTPGALTEATAEVALLLTLMVARRAGEGERLLRAGQWKGWSPTQLLGQDLRGKTLGLVGFGRIARETARRARTLLDVRIVYHSRSRASVDEEMALGATYHESLPALLAASDIVSLHCPGGATTRHLLNKQTLECMKSTAILINTSRGSVVDDDALADALSRGVISAAGLDVYEAEPVVHPTLLKLENVVLLPHLGSATIQTRTAMGMQAADNLDAFFSGITLPSRVA